MKNFKEATDMLSELLSYTGCSFKVSAFENHGEIGFTVDVADRVSMTGIAEIEDLDDLKYCIHRYLLSTDLAEEIEILREEVFDLQAKIVSMEGE